MSETPEQQARDMLERMGVDDAQSFSSGDVVELANLIHDLAASKSRERALREALRQIKNTAEERANDVPHVDPSFMKAIADCANSALIPNPEA